MSTRLNQYRLASNDDFRGVVEAAAIVAAGSVVNEDPATPNHAERMQLAKVMLTGFGGQFDREYYLRRLRWIAAMNPAIQGSAVSSGVVDASNVLDNDIDFVVASEWNAIATTEL